MAGYSNKKIENSKLFRYLRHFGYRVSHYGAKALAMPGRAWDYLWGALIYQRSPYRCHMRYREFAREHGRYGEFQLWRKARRCLSRKTVWFRNVYLPKEDGTTLEIDLLAVSPKGILVFESKNYSGMIFGDEAKPYWYQLIRKNVRYPYVKYSFFNPIMQNSMHCRHLARILEEDRSRIFSFVVFGNGAKLKKIRLSEQHAVVCRQNAIGKYIRKRKNVLNAEEINGIAEKLLPFSDHSAVQTYKHIKALTNKNRY